MDVNMVFIEATNITNKTKWEVKAWLKYYKKPMYEPIYTAVTLK